MIATLENDSLLPKVPNIVVAYNSSVIPVIHSSQLTLSRDLFANVITSPPNFLMVSLENKNVFFIPYQLNLYFERS